MQPVEPQYSKEPLVLEATKDEWICEVSGFKCVFSDAARLSSS